MASSVRKRHYHWRCTLSAADTAVAPAQESGPVAPEASAGKTKPVAAKQKHHLPTWWWVVLVFLVATAALTFVPGLLGAVNNPDQIHQPGLDDFFPEAAIWDGTAFRIDRMVIARFVATIALIIIFVSVVVRLKMRPGRGQLLIEMLLEFVRKNIGIELLGTSRGRRYATLLAVTFVGTLAMNLMGVVPWVNIAASSVMSVPLVFAVVSYFAFIIAGIKARGGWGFFKEQLFPPGIPWPVYFLLTPIEMMSTFIVRPATLAIRLLANMIAGHMLLALTYFGTQTLLVSFIALKPLSVLTFAGSIVVTLFEAFVGVLQAYVFAILTGVYIKMSVESH